MAEPTKNQPNYNIDQKTMDILNTFDSALFSIAKNIPKIVKPGLHKIVWVDKKDFLEFRKRFNFDPRGTAIEIETAKYSEFGVPGISQKVFSVDGLVSIDGFKVKFTFESCVVYPITIKNEIED